MKIKDIPSKLISLPLLEVGRAGTLDWFHFGYWQEYRMRNGALKTVGTCAIHLQCPWRIQDHHKILVAAFDRYEPSGINNATDDFQWDKPGANKCDRLVKELCAQHSKSPLIVNHCNIDIYGGLTIMFQNNISLNVFPCKSAHTESWRFIQFSGDNSKHLVVWNKNYN
jgi:hypothetical protein